MMSKASLVRRVLKPLVLVGGLLPFGLLLWGAWRGDLGANPLETVTHTTRRLGAALPLRRLLGQAWPLQLRRMLGLFAFFYASLHLLIWLVLDQEMALRNILADIAERPYVTVGFLAWLLLVPLALTSTRGAMRRLGRNWSRLHRLGYPIGILGVLHFLWTCSSPLFMAPYLHCCWLSGCHWGVCGSYACGNPAAWVCENGIPSMFLRHCWSGLYCVHFKTCIRTGLEEDGNARFIGRGVFF